MVERKLSRCVCVCVFAATTVWGCRWLINSKKETEDLQRRGLQQEWKTNWVHCSRTLTFLLPKSQYTTLHTLGHWVCLFITHTTEVPDAVNKKTQGQPARAWITCRQSALGWICLGSGGREVVVALTNNTPQAVNMEPLEEYHSPFDFEQGVNASYLYLSPAYSDTPPSSPAVKTRGKHREWWERLCVCVCAHALDTS